MVEWEVGDSLRKALINSNLYEMSPTEIAVYARDAKKVLESADSELTRLREQVVKLTRALHAVLTHTEDRKNDSLPPREEG